MPTLPVTFTRALARWGGRPGRSVATGLDLVTSTGARALLQRRKEEKEYAARELKRRVNRRIWGEAAEACGASIGDLGGGFLEIVRGAAAVRVRMQVTPLDDEVSLQLALDKTITHSLLRAKGVPVPEHVSFELADAGAALRLIEGGGEWVVKPAEGAGSGHGTTTGVRTEADFFRASARAARASRRQLLERQVPGDEYRLLLLDGELLGAVRRSPPSVVGDGVSTIAQLVHAENRRRLEALGDEGVMLVTLDLDAVMTLNRAGVDPATVPPAGATVCVKRASNQAGRRESEAVDPGAFSPDLVDEARRAAKAVGLRLAGVDLIASDLERSLAASGGAIIEVNGTPGLHYHYLVSNPAAAASVAVPILATLLDGAGN